MGVATVDRKIGRNAGARPVRVSMVKRIVLGIVRPLTLDSEAIFRSKDWPYLWPK